MTTDLQSRFELSRRPKADTAGEIIRGVDQATGHAVDVVLVGGGAEGEERRHQFLLRADKLASLNKRSFADVVQTGPYDEHVAAMVLAVPKGDELAGRLALEPPGTAGELLGLLGQILAALDLLHNAGLVHGNLGTRSIVLSGGGRFGYPILTRFALVPGLTPMREPGAGVDDLARATALISPEQLAHGDERLLPSDDLYALGVIVHAAFAGTPPFGGRTAAIVRRAVLSGKPVPLGQVRSDLPDDFATCVDRAIDPDRNARYVNATSMRRALMTAAFRSPDLRKLLLRPPSDEPAPSRRSSFPPEPNTRDHTRPFTLDASREPGEAVPEMLSETTKVAPRRGLEVALRRSARDDEPAPGPPEGARGEDDEPEVVVGGAALGDDDEPEVAIAGAADDDDDEPDIEISGGPLSSRPPPRASQPPRSSYPPPLEAAQARRDAREAEARARKQKAAADRAARLRAAQEEAERHRAEEAAERRAAQEAERRAAQEAERRAAQEESDAKEVAQREARAAAAREREAERERIARMRALENVEREQAALDAELDQQLEARDAAPSEPPPEPPRMPSEPSIVVDDALTAPKRPAEETAPIELVSRRSAQAVSAIEPSLGGDEEDEPKPARRGSRAWLVGPLMLIIGAVSGWLLAAGEIPLPEWIPEPVRNAAVPPHARALAPVAAGDAGLDAPSLALGAAMDEPMGDAGVATAPDASVTDGGAPDGSALAPDGGVADLADGGATEPLPLEPARFTVYLPSLPRHTRISLDDESVDGRDVIALEVPDDGQPHALTIRAPGYERVERELTPASAGPLEVTLEAAERSRRRRRHRD